LSTRLGGLGTLVGRRVEIGRRLKTGPTNSAAFPLSEKPSDIAHECLRHVDITQLISRLLTAAVPGEPQIAVGYSAVPVARVPVCRVRRRRLTACRSNPDGHPRAVEELKEEFTRRECYGT
jgi:hypothetical protein